MSKSERRGETRFALLVLLALMLAAALVGCGGGGGGGGGGGTPGGGGGGGGTPPPAGTAVLTGRVVDNGQNGVSGAKILISGTGVTATTASDGTFRTAPFSIAATQFTVLSPDVTVYPNVITYQNSTYNIDPNRQPPCAIALPVLTSGQVSALPGVIVMFSNSGSGSGSPPPPPSGCYP